MKNIFMLILVATICFIIVKITMIVLDQVITRVFKVESNSKFELILSIGMQAIFVVLWISSIQAVVTKYGMTELEFYISFCMIGIANVVWSYFSWDAAHIFVKPRWSRKNERKVKKICVFMTLLAFSFMLGYQQTLHLINKNYEVNILFSFWQYSVIASSIAFDRIMNLICPEEKYKYGEL